MNRLWLVLLAFLQPIIGQAADYTNYSRLFSFGGTDGANPLASLIEGSDGRLYGTAFEGGHTNVPYPAGMGTVFSLNKDGSGFKVLHYFKKDRDGRDGRHPYGELVEGRFGSLYGTTRDGGRFGHGTIFKLNKSGR